MHAYMLALMHVFMHACMLTCLQRGDVIVTVHSACISFVSNNVKMGVIKTNKSAVVNVYTLLAGRP